MFLWSGSSSYHSNESSASTLTYSTINKYRVNNMWAAYKDAPSSFVLKKKQKNNCINNKDRPMVWKLVFTLLWWNQGETTAFWAVRAHVQPCLSGSCIPVSAAAHHRERGSRACRHMNTLPMQQITVVLWDNEWLCSYTDSEQLTETLLCRRTCLAYDY